MSPEPELELKVLKLTDSIFVFTMPGAMAYAEFTCRRGKE